MRRESEDWTLYDLRDMLPNPVRCESVRHQVDGSEPDTQIALYSQSEFPLVVCAHTQRDIVGESYENQYSRCVSGFHRASTYGKTRVEMLNQLVNSDGSRAYNAQQFALHALRRDDAIQQAIDSAITWSQGPWKTMRGGIRDRESLYAYESTSSRRGACENFELIWDWIDGINAIGVDVYKTMLLNGEASRITTRVSLVGDTQVLWDAAPREPADDQGDAVEAVEADGDHEEIVGRDHVDDRAGGDHVGPPLPAYSPPTHMVTRGKGKAKMPPQSESARAGPYVPPPPPPAPVRESAASGSDGRDDGQEHFHEVRSYDEPWMVYNDGPNSGW